MFFVCVIRQLYFFTCEATPSQIKLAAVRHCADRDASRCIDTRGLRESDVIVELSLLRGLLHNYRTISADTRVTNFGSVRSFYGANVFHGRKRPHVEPALSFYRVCHTLYTFSLDRFP